MNYRRRHSYKYNSHYNTATINCIAFARSVSMKSDSQERQHYGLKECLKPCKQKDHWNLHSIASSYCHWVWWMIRVACRKWRRRLRIRQFCRLYRAGAWIGKIPRKHKQIRKKESGRQSNRILKPHEENTMERTWWIIYLGREEIYRGSLHLIGRLVWRYWRRDIVERIDTFR